MAEMQIATVQYVSPPEMAEAFAAADARLTEALAQLVTQAALTQALSGLAVKTEVVAAIAQAVTAAVAPLATREQVETAKQQAITQATNGRPNYTAMRNEIAAAIAPLVARIAAIEAR